MSKKGVKKMKDNFPFTKEEVNVAYQTSIIDLVQQYGYELKDERKVYRVCDNAGLFLWKDGLGWYHGSTYEKGNNVEFLMKYCGIVSKSEAIKLLLDYAHITPSATVRHEVKKQEARQLQLPPKAKTYNNMYAYLISTRKIDKDVVYLMQKLKKIYQDNHRNCVFVGRDESGKPAYGSVRGTGYKQYRGDCLGSDKSVGFTYEGTSNTVYTFEAPIDLMSHMTLMKQKGLDWQKDSRVSLGGLAESALERFLKNHPNIKEVVLCMDNDYKEEINSGQKALIRMGRKFKEQSFTVKRLLPQMPYKDLNEQLQGMMNAQEHEECLEMSG